MILFHCKIVVVISAAATFKIRLILYFLNLVITEMFVFTAIKWESLCLRVIFDDSMIFYDAALLLLGCA